MKAAAATVSDPQAAKVALVIDALSRDASLTRAERALLDEVDQVPAVITARAAYSRREEEAAHLAEEARLEALRAEQAQREAELLERIEARRKLWRSADPLVRACHVLAERVGDYSQDGKLLLALAGLVTNTKETLLTRKRFELGKWVPREERAPPLTFEPMERNEDPVEGA